MDLIKKLHALTSRLTILYVEDDEQLRNQMKGLLGELFKKIDIAEDGQDGLNHFNEYLLRNNKPYDLVITDINMPEMNGIELIHEIYQTHPLQAVVVVSAHNESDYLLELLHLGINSFLIKPIQHNSFINTLYKVTKSLVNERLVEKNYKEIEQLNEELSFKSLALEESNDKLQSKNIALEKSLRIIEGMQHKNQLHKKISLPKQLLTPYTQQKNDETKKQSLLIDIEKIINKMALTHPNQEIDNITLEALSHAVTVYTQSLPNDESYNILISSLNRLAIALQQRPKCSSEQEVKKIIGILESFFFIYSKWEKEWHTIEKEDFKMFCISIEDEINTLIDVWHCKI